MINFFVNQQVGKKIPSRIWQNYLKNISQVLKLKNQTEISIALVGNQAIKKLNYIYRGKNKVTDVLSFREKDIDLPANLSEKNYLGEIVICYPQAKRQAGQNSHSLNVEIKTLFVHGFLHLLGYDHKKSQEAEKMRKLEQKIIKTKTQKPKNDKTRP